MQVLIVALFAVLFTAPSARAYGWPLKPTNAPHPVRGNLGDPRTVFRQGILDAEGLAGDGAFSFHNGVDIAAGPWEPVYPVVGGYVSTASGTTVAVRATGNRVFKYMHVQPRVEVGTWVVAGRSILGSVYPSAAHVHLAEIQNGVVMNPLAPGRLMPYRDTTAPEVIEIGARDLDGAPVNPAQLGGSVLLTATAQDFPSLAVPGAWAGFPVAPALVTWSLRAANGTLVIRDRVAVDFRRALPPPRDFWRVYVRGTHQNRPRFGNRQYLKTPGRYEFLLTPDWFDTHDLPDGSYSLTVRTSDIGWNASERSTTLTLCNSCPARRSG